MAEARAATRQPNTAERAVEPNEQGRAARAPAPAAETEITRRAGTAAVAGTLLEHGAGSYKHDPDEPPSYRVRLDTARGERELWGVDLKRAVATSGAELGDTVELERVEATPVTVESNRRDERGRVVGIERVAATRRGSAARVAECREALEAVSAAFVAHHASSEAARERLGAAMRERLEAHAQVGTLPPVPSAAISAEVVGQDVNARHLKPDVAHPRAVAGDQGRQVGRRELRASAFLGTRWFFDRREARTALRFAPVPLRSAMS